MAFWITLRDQLLALWNRWTIAQRAGFSAATVACVAAIVGTMIWAAQPDYVVLADKLTLQKSNEIIGILDTEKISYRLNSPASAVSVPSSDVARARMALASIISPENEPNVAAAGLLPGSPGEEEDRRLAGLEKQIERNIKQIRGIQSATVKVSRPNPSPFVDDQSPVTAAIVIETRGGETISTSIANSIIANVAGSVPGLVPDNIVMTDTNGRQYGGNGGMEAELAHHLNYRQQKEAYFVHRIESHLNRIRGVQASVVVSAEIDFNQRTTTSNKIDASGKAKRTTQLNSVEQKGSRILPVGPAGSASNIAVAANTQNDSMGSYKVEDINEDFIYPETHEQVNSIGGDILRLSVSAIVDISGAEPATPAPADTNSSATPPAVTLTKEDLENIIKSAIGFSDTREDQIDVTLAALEPIELAEPVIPGFVWEQWQPLLQSVSLGLAAMLAFLISMMLMKRMKPIIISEATGRGIPLADARRLATIAEQAKAHPDVVADILTAWLNEREANAADGKPFSMADQMRTPSAATGGNTATKSANSSTSAAKAA